MWNYRVIKDTQFIPDAFDNETEVSYYFISEVYYNDAGGIWAWSGPMEPGGEEFEDLVFEVNAMARALSEPILDINDLPTTEDLH